MQKYHAITNYMELIDGCITKIEETEFITEPNEFVFFESFRRLFAQAKHEFSKQKEAFKQNSGVRIGNEE